MPAASRVICGLSACAHAHPKIAAAHSTSGATALRRSGDRQKASRSPPPSRPRTPSFIRGLLSAPGSLCTIMAGSHPNSGAGRSTVTVSTSANATMSGASTSICGLAADFARTVAGTANDGTVSYQQRAWDEGDVLGPLVNLRCKRAGLGLTSGLCESSDAELLTQHNQVRLQVRKFGGGEIQDRGRARGAVVLLDPLLCDDKAQLSRLDPMGVCSGLMSRADSWRLRSLHFQMYVPQNILRLRHALRRLSG